MPRLSAFKEAIRRYGSRDSRNRSADYQLPGTHPATRASEQLRKHRTYPLYYYPLTLPERLMVKTGFGGVGRCLVCGTWTGWKIHTDNLRETGFCRKCNAMNRFRALAYVACRSLGLQLGRSIRSFKEMAALPDLMVYNTECHSAVHRTLMGMENYVASEYHGSQFAGGETVHGVMHQDLMDLSFPDKSFDLVLSTDVFEHIPDPYKRHREVYRVLRRGGRHIFTVPFDQAQFLDDLRAVVESDGTTRLLRPPVYHHDPLRPEDGCLVYSFFAIEMLARLRRIGFRTHLYRIREPRYGIFGQNNLVFEAIKWDPPSELPSDDWFRGTPSSPWDQADD